MGVSDFIYFYVLSFHCLIGEIQIRKNPKKQMIMPPHLFVGISIAKEQLVACRFKCLCGAVYYYQINVLLLLNHCIIIILMYYYYYQITVSSLDYCIIIELQYHYQIIALISNYNIIIRLLHYYYYYYYLLYVVLFSICGRISRCGFLGYFAILNYNNVKM